MNLKPCPFCAGPAGYMHRSIGEDVVFCRKCGVRMDMVVSSDVTASRWNLRTPEPGTSVIRWTRYDGTPETLPEDGQKVLLVRANQGKFPPITAYFERYDPISEWVLGGGNADVQKGDAWAGMPDLPEGIE